MYQIQHFLPPSFIVSLDKDRKYQVDRRGIYFAGAYKFLSDNKIETSIELKKKITLIESSNKPAVIIKRIQEIADIVNRYDVIDRQEMKYFVFDNTPERFWSETEDDAKPNYLNIAITFGSEGQGKENISRSEITIHNWEKIQKSELK